MRGLAAPFYNYNNQRINTMAFKKKQDDPNKVLATNVVQLTLLPDMVAELMTMQLQAIDLYAKVFSLLDEGYNINLTKDLETGVYSVRLAAVTKGLLNEGNLLYGNGSVLVNAFLSVYGKHFLLAGKLPWTAVQTNGLEMS